MDRTQVQFTIFKYNDGGDDYVCCEQFRRSKLPNLETFQSNPKEIISL